MCFYDHLDDLGGHLVKYFITLENEPALELLEIHCEGTSCQRTSLVPIGPTSNLGGRLVHRADGTPAFLHRRERYSSAIHLTTTSSTLEVMPSGRAASGRRGASARPRRGARRRAPVRGDGSGGGRVERTGALASLRFAVQALCAMASPRTSSTRASSPQSATGKTPDSVSAGCARIAPRPVARTSDIPWQSAV